MYRIYIVIQVQSSVQKAFVLNADSLILSVRVATVTGIALILVTTHSLVVIVGLRVGMAPQTTEGGIVATSMAVYTLIPFILVFPGENGEVHPVVIEGGWYPGGFVVAVGTGCREAHGLVRWIVGGVVVALVASNAGCRRIVREVSVTGCATHGSVSSVQWPYAAVIKCGRYPGCLIVTDSTVCRKSGRLMVRIGGGIVIILVASNTGIRRIVVVTVVAGCTIIGYIGMCPE
jgi:hypothetical protein